MMRTDILLARIRGLCEMPTNVLLPKAMDEWIWEYGTDLQVTEATHLIEIQNLRQ